MACACVSKAMACAATRTHEVAGPDVFLDVWLDRSRAYGGGIFLSGVIESVISKNRIVQSPVACVMTSIGFAPSSP